MLIESVGALAPGESAGLPGAIPELGGIDQATLVQSPAVGGFGQMVSHGLSGVNHDLIAAQTDLQELATGNVQNLHQIMIRLEENRLSFQLFMQVRNRLLEAYQDIMKMQV